jgi:hypothetical protein
LGGGETARLHPRHAALPARCARDVAMMTMPVMVPGMMAGVMRMSVPPCAVLRLCGGRRGDGEQCHRTRSQRNETKRPAKRNN